MVEIRAASDGEIAAWFADWTQRIREWYGSFGASAAWVEGEVVRRTAIPDGVTRSTYAVVTDGLPAGFLTARISPDRPSSHPTLTDIWVDPSHRRRGIGTSARQWAEEWARSLGRSLMLVTNPADGASQALFRDYPVRYQSMMKHLPTSVASPGGVEARPMNEPEFRIFREDAICGFAEASVAAGLVASADAVNQSAAQFDDMAAAGLATPDNSFLTLHAGGERVGVLWLSHHFQPGTSFVCEVEVDPAHRGRGYGRAAMMLAEQASIDAGDKDLGLSVFGYNTAAINLYTSIGYAVVEQGRSTGEA